MQEGQYAFLEPTRERFQRIKNFLQSNERVTVLLWDTLKELLLAAELGSATSMWLIQRLRWRFQVDELRSGTQVYAILRQELVHLLGSPSPLRYSRTTPTTLMMVIGAPGSGKTTMTHKLAQRLTQEGKDVLIIPVGTNLQGALQAAQEQHRDVVLIDTGNYGTGNHLSQLYTTELKDAFKTIGSVYSGRTQLHEILLTVDATQGSSSLLGLRSLAEDIGLTGALLTKADDTPKAGCAFALADDLGTPVKFLGTGPQDSDLLAFDPEHFIAALLDN